MKIIIKHEKLLEKDFFKKLMPLIAILVVIIVCISAIAVKRKNIILITDGNKLKFVTYKDTVKEALDAKNVPLDSKDITIPSLNCKIKNNQIIILKKAVTINVNVDGKNLQIKSAQSNIANMLKAEKISLSKYDSITPRENTPLKKGLKVVITRVNSKIIKKHIVENFKTLTKVDPNLANNKKRIVQKGRNGEKELTYELTYHDGKLFSQKLINQTTLRKTIDSLIVVGGYPLVPVSNDGKLLGYSKKFVARATAYWAVRGVGRTFTGSGRRAIRNARGWSTVAVDRHLYPYGTKMFIEGYGFAVAADTGTAIKGNTIDVFFNTRAEACRWAVKHPTVYILK